MADNAGSGALDDATAVQTTSRGPAFLRWVPKVGVGLGVSSGLSSRPRSWRPRWQLSARLFCH